MKCDLYMCFYNKNNICENNEDYISEEDLSPDDIGCQEFLDNECCIIKDCEKCMSPCHMQLFIEITKYGKCLPRKDRRNEDKNGIRMVNRI